MHRSNVIVCDSGSGYVKAGYAGATFPENDSPCAVGSADANGARVFVGRQQLVDPPQQPAPPHRDIRIIHPIVNGIVQDWDAMEAVWSHTFRDVLSTDPAGKTVMLTEQPGNPLTARQRTLEIMFERFGLSEAYIQGQAVLSLYSQGLLSGLVLESGHGITHAVPVFDGYTDPLLAQRLPVAGRHITHYLLELLQRRGHPLSLGTDLPVAEGIKESACYVARDYSQEVKLARETVCRVERYTLPDGRTIRIGAERFAAPEALFNPSLLGVESPGVAELVHRCIHACPIDLRLPLYEHVVLSGGTTMFPGFPSRLEEELRSLYREKVLKGETAGVSKLKLRVDDPPRRKHTVFIGAAVLADIMKDQREFWVSKAEWEEDPRRAAMKCGGGRGG